MGLLRAAHAGFLETVPCRLTHLSEDLGGKARSAPLDVVWLVRQISKAKTQAHDYGAELAAENLRDKLSSRVQADADWKKAATALRAIKNLSLAGQFAQAGVVLLKLCGGQRENKHLRDGLDLWTGAVRGMGSMTRIEGVFATQAVPLDKPAVTLASSMQPKAASGLTCLRSASPTGCGLIIGLCRAANCKKNGGSSTWVSPARN